MAKEHRLLTVREAKGMEFTHLHIQCDCRIVHVPWQLLKGIGEDQVISDFARKLRCLKCDGRAHRDEVWPTAQFEAAGAGRGPFK